MVRRRQGGGMSEEQRAWAFARHCRESPFEKIAELLENGADVNELDDQGRAPLYVAACDGRVDVVDLLVQHGANLEQWGDRALNRACYCGHVEVVKYLASLGVNMHVFSASGCSLLIHAISLKDTQMLKFLLGEGLSVMDEDDSGISVFSSVMNRPEDIDLETFHELFKDQQLDVNIRGKNGQTALHKLCSSQWSSCLDKIKFLLTCGGKEALGIEDDEGYLPLHFAARLVPYSRLTIPVLIDAGADVRAPTRAGRSSLDIMLFEHDYPPDKIAFPDVPLSVMHKLISHGADWDAGCERRYRFLEKLMGMSKDEFYEDWAKRRQSEDYDESIRRVVSTWFTFEGMKRSERENPSEGRRRSHGVIGDIDRHLNPLVVFSGLRKCALCWMEERKSGGEVAMSPIPYQVTQLGEAEVAKWFKGSSGVRDAITLNATLKRGVLHDACAKGKPVETILELLARGYDPNGFDDEGETPLQCAARSGHVDIAQTLLDSGATLDAPCKDGSSILMVACAHGRLNFVKHFVSQGADVNALDQNGRSLLHAAIPNNHSELIAYLLSQGADPMAVDIEGISVLYAAADKGKGIRIETLRLLVSLGLDLLALDSSDHRLLHKVMIGETCLETAEYLIVNGLAVADLDQNGQTAVHVLCDSKQSLTLEKLTFLLDHGGSATLSIHDESGYTPLHCALRSLVHVRHEENDRVAIVDSLLDAGAHPQMRTMSGRNPLEILVFEGCKRFYKNTPAYKVLYDITRLLCSRGVSWDESCEKRYEYALSMANPPENRLSRNKLEVNGVPPRFSDDIERSIFSLMGRWHDYRANDIFSRSVNSPDINPTCAFSGIRACILQWTNDRKQGEGLTEFPIEVVQEGEELVALWLAEAVFPTE